MTNYEDTNDVVHHLRFQAALDEAVAEEAAFHEFEEHFKASSEDPYFENELKLWLTAWRKALAYRQSSPVGVEAYYHPCTSILIEGLKRLEGGSDVLVEWDRARAQADTTLAQQLTAGNEVEYEYEVWQDGVLQAGGRENDYASAKSEANHYAMMYIQDGPVEIFIYEKRRVAHARRSQQFGGRDNG